MLINSSIEDHINRRLARIIQSQHYSSLNKQTANNLMSKKKNRNHSPKKASSCGELGSGMFFNKI